MHKKIFLLSIPLVLSNIAIPFIGVINTALIGHLHNSSYLAATALGISIVNLVCFLFAFFRMSMTGLIAQSFGQQDFAKMAELVLRAVILAIVMSVAMLLLKPLIYLAMVYVINADSDVLILLNNFYNIAIYMLLFALLSYVFIGFFIGVQKTKIILYASFILTSLSIVLSIVFVNLYNMNVNGIAYSMLISQALQTLFLLVMIIRYFAQRNISIANVFTQDFFKIANYLPFLKLNANIFIRSVCLLISFNSFYVFSSYYGKDTLAANAILVEIAVFIAMFLDALANTTETLVGEAYINRQADKFREVVIKTFIQCLLISIIFSVIYGIFHSQILDLFTSISSVRIEIDKYVIFSIVLPIFAAFSFWIDGVFVGMLKTVAMRNAMLLSMLTYILLVVILSPMGNYGLWLAMLGFYVARVVFLAYPLKRVLKSRR